MRNEKNLFTGSVDVPLTRRGVEEVVEAGKRISNVLIDLVYTSALIHLQMTGVLAFDSTLLQKGIYLVRVDRV